MALVSKEKVIIKNTPNINEDMIQRFISENPLVLGLGDLTLLTREKIQSSKGRIDIVFQNDNNTRFEVEVQLGATDPSHIIRTIEYWDIERKKHPQYDHCAVIIAEEITGRFMNVISLFNGAIPLISIQLSAYKDNNDYILTFTKVLDSQEPSIEEDENYEPTDRVYWENKSTQKMMNNVDYIFSEVGLPDKGFELKYNKWYIGIEKNGFVTNFISFRPKKNHLYLMSKGYEDTSKIEKIEKAGFEVTYNYKEKRYEIRINKIEQFNHNKELFISLIKDSMQFYNVDIDE